MTTNNTVIFRRFDEVHVQLLVCLQDEITSLERELMKLNNAKEEGLEDRPGERGEVLRELRRVVGEYGKALSISPRYTTSSCAEYSANMVTIVDHLFSSWSQMKASKVSESTTNNLKEWLERPSASTSISKDAKEDLDWLKKNDKDMSSVSVDSDEKEGKRESSQEIGGSGGDKAGRKRGFLALFGGCAGRRKG